MLRHLHLLGKKARKRSADQVRESGRVRNNNRGRHRNSPERGLNSYLSYPSGGNIDMMVVGVFKVTEREV